MKLGMWQKPALFAFAGIFGLWLLFVGGVTFLAFARPPQPLPLGAYQWLGEGGVTVTGVDRVSRISAGKQTAKATGIFYIVHAIVSAPFGLRPLWSDRDVEVQTFAGRGRSNNVDVTYYVDSRAQALEDLLTHRPGSEHEIRGATQHEDLVFDLPVDVEQPGLIVKPANSPMGLLNLVFGHIWQPHRFNLRYD